MSKTDSNASNLLNNAPKKMGRPTDYTVKKGEDICELIASGKTMRWICRHEEMPSFPTVQRWRRQFPDFHQALTIARIDQAENWADENIEIADDTSEDMTTKVNRRGVEYEDFDTNHINRDRLRIQARQWQMSKTARGTYGDTVDVKHSGEVNHTVRMDDREKMRRLAAMLLEDKLIKDEARLNVLPGEAVEVPEAVELAPSSTPDEPEPT